MYGTVRRANIFDHLVIVQRKGVHLMKGFFKCKLRIRPFNTNLDFNGWRPLLKRRAFEQCKATNALAVMRQSL